MSGEPLALRPHHGMCLRHFAGRGYSRGFAANMGRVKAALTQDIPVRLAAEADAVCAACPNNRGGVCDKPSLVAGYDRAVLAFCDLQEGQVLPYGTFAVLVEERILLPGRRREICGGCQWDGLCGGAG